MSWLTEKLFGKKQRISSCHFGDSVELKDSGREYDQMQLWNFISQRQHLEAQIIGYELRSAERYVIYRISVNALGQEYTIDRRYSEFKELHDHYSRFMPEYDNPNFPGTFKSLL